MSLLSAEKTDYDLSTTGVVAEADVSTDAQVGWFIDGTAGVDYVVEARGRRVGYRQIDSFTGAVSVEDKALLPEAARVRIRNTSTATGTAQAVLGSDTSTAVIASPTTAAEQVVAGEDLIAWYRFEDGVAEDYTASLSGTFGDETDFSGTVNGATFVPSGGVTDLLAGANSGAFDFDGTDDFISTNLNTLSTPFTVAAWHSPDTLAEHAVVSGWNSTKRDWYISVNRSGNKKVEIVDDNRTNVPGATVSAGQLFHTVAVYADNANELYVDGTLSNSVTGISSATYPHDVFIGALNPTVFNGDATIDDVRIYSRELSAAEIQTIFNNTKP
jgi:hypothetical protein